jgi:hypothetical protein
MFVKLVVTGLSSSCQDNSACFYWSLSHCLHYNILCNTLACTFLQIAPEQGQLLSVLVQLLGVTSAIEVGVFTGYSSLAVAMALPPNGRLVAFDRDPVSMEVARRWAGCAAISQGCCWVCDLLQSCFAAGCRYCYTSVVVSATIVAKAQGDGRVEFKGTLSAWRLRAGELAK